MEYAYRPCELEMDYAAYMKFLIRNQGRLGLPYPFAMKLSFLAGPLILGKAMLLFSEEPYDLVGAAGFICGTGANDYEDRHVCQVEVAFLQEQHRHPFVFLRGLRTLLELMKQEAPEVALIQFWVQEEGDASETLWAKLLQLPGSRKQAEHQMTRYTVPYEALAAYCQRLLRGRENRY